MYFLVRFDNANFLKHKSQHKHCISLTNVFDEFIYLGYHLNVKIYEKVSFFKNDNANQDMGGNSGKQHLL